VALVIVSGITVVTLAIDNMAGVKSAESRVHNIATLHMFKPVELVTKWEVWNDKAKSWEHNHIEPGHVDADTPTVKCLSQKAWGKADVAKVVRPRR